MFSHPPRDFPFANKHISADGERGLVTGFQVTDEDDDQQVRAGPSQFIQSRVRVTGEQPRIYHQHIGMAIGHMGQFG